MRVGNGYPANPVVLHLVALLKLSSQASPFVKQLAVGLDDRACEISCADLRGVEGIAAALRFLKNARQIRGDPRLRIG